MLFPALFDTLTFASIKHQYQRRGGYKKLPYINHLIKVANILIQIGKEEDLTTLQAAILHDILEDEHATVEELTGKFGLAVCAIVEELTDDMSLSYADRKQIQISKAADLSLPAKKIKLADKTCNIRDIVDYPLAWDDKRKLAYITWSIKVIDQLRGTNSALEQYFDESVAYGMNKLKRN